MSLVYFRGEFFALDDVQASPFERGFLFGEGVNEVVSLYKGLLFRFDGRFDRFE